MLWVMVPALRGGILNWRPKMLGELFANACICMHLSEPRAPASVKFPKEVMYLQELRLPNTPPRVWWQMPQEGQGTVQS